MTTPPPSPEELEELLLGGPRRYSREEVAAEAGVDLERARRYWRALGFADVGEAVAFTEADAVALERVVRLTGSAGVDESFALSLTRALGQTTARLAEWQVQALHEHLVEAEGLDDVSAHAQVRRFLLDHVQDVAAMLLYAWLRQLAAVAARSAGGRDEASSTREQSVGFADLVSYTRLAQRLDERGLAALVQRFDERASDVITAAGGRVVKTVGDEVLFVADTPVAAAETALGLAEAMSADPVLPDVRVGLARGPVVSRLGDVFGGTVNLASRLTGLAVPGSVLVDARTAASLAGAPAYTLEPRHGTEVPDAGSVDAAVLRRAGR